MLLCQHQRPHMVQNSASAKTEHPAICLMFALTATQTVHSFGAQASKLLCNRIVLPQALKFNSIVVLLVSLS